MDLRIGTVQTDRFRFGTGVSAAGIYSVQRYNGHPFAACSAAALGCLPAV